jgi:ABC-type spermidine/putrescine transport system permease subunit I
MSFLTSAELSLGVGFGLFAIFSVLRYRTSTMSTREMACLLIVVALPVMNSVLMRSDEWIAFLAVNAVVAMVLCVLKREWGFHYENSRSIRYDRIDLITS